MPMCKIIAAVDVNLMEVKDQLAEVLSQRKELHDINRELKLRLEAALEEKMSMSKR